MQGKLQKQYDHRLEHSLFSSGFTQKTSGKVSTGVSTPPITWKDRGGARKGRPPVHRLAAFGHDAWILKLLSPVLTNALGPEYRAQTDVRKHVAHVSRDALLGKELRWAVERLAGGRYSYARWVYKT